MELSLKPTSAKVKDYYKALNQFGHLYVSHEMAVRQAFASLLGSCARPWDWTLVHELRIELPTKKSVIVDGAILTAFRRHHGYWEAKDLKDDLEKEIKKKLAAGYPRKNIIFQTPERAILYQNGARQGLNEDITDPKNLVGVLKRFFEFREPHEEEWEQAVKEFSPRIPEIAAAAKELINKERRTNKAFVTAFDDFVRLCRQAINPSLSDESVEKMLIQHLLTERIFRKVFNNPEFTRRNIIAAEIEKVIDSLTSKHFSRDAFLKDLDYFYRAIEENAKDATDYSEKQGFLNTVYERFFQSFSPKEADTHGIVYTPQPIVNFMVRSVEEILKKEFGKSLGDREVHILDPFVGTGNFIVRVMQEIPKTRLQYKYENELHCNEVMLLPYYIASMNIEHAYLDATTEYKSFEGICLVDTFELAEPEQSGFEFMTAENTTRVHRQKKAPIYVILGNPPYNAAQMSENDNNKNRTYEYLDKKISETYVADSKATLANKLNDPYVRAIRWASERLTANGIVAYVSNSSFMTAESFDGMRTHLENDFSSIHLIDLKGDARTAGERRRKEAGNVFDDQIRVGVGITFFVRNENFKNRPARLFKYSVDDYLSSAKKKELLNGFGSFLSVPYSPVVITGRHAWFVEPPAPEFEMFLPLCSKFSKSPHEVIFADFSLGCSTNRDDVVYGFDSASLTERVQNFISNFNSESYRYSHFAAEKREKDFDFSSKVKWSETLKRRLARGIKFNFQELFERTALTRPFTKKYIYYDPLVIDRPGRFREILPVVNGKSLGNVVLCCSAVADKRSFYCIATSIIPDLHLTGDTQTFSFYNYDEDGTNRRENITDWALEQFRSHYKDKSITKWDIFYYTYAVLHHLEYRTRYAANLKRELPRIPYAPDFHAFAKAGKRLAELHADYEKQEEYKGLERLEKPREKLNLRVEKMRLSKDKQTLVYNDFLTLTDIPKETYDYRLGHQSALEWVIDQYQVSTDKRSGITNDPNREDDKEYILRLIGQVITVSLETVKIVNALPDLGLPASSSSEEVRELGPEDFAAILRQSEGKDGRNRPDNN